jgi:hypothetical protein
MKLGLGAKAAADDVTARRVRAETRSCIVVCDLSDGTVVERIYERQQWGLQWKQDGLCAAEWI